MTRLLRWLCRLGWHGKLIRVRPDERSRLCLRCGATVRVRGDSDRWGGFSAGS